MRFRGSLQPLSRASLSPTGVRHEVPVSAATAAGESGMITNPTQASIAGLPWAAVRIPTAGPMPPLVTSCP